MEVSLRGGSYMWDLENTKMMYMARWSRQFILMDLENMASGLNIGTLMHPVQTMIGKLGYNKWEVQHL